MDDFVAAGIVVPGGTLAAGYRVVLVATAGSEDGVRTTLAEVLE